MRYEHTQRSPLWLFVSIPLFIISAVVAAASDGDTVAVSVGVGVSLVVIGLVANFSRLQVTVSEDEVTVAFGLGWPSRTIAIGDVTGVELVRNKWYWGWGIRVIPGGWMWNAWGLDGVEIALASGRVFRIGTDDPQGLYGALMSVVRSP